MKEQIINLMANYGGVIIFLHVLSAIIWIGGMIAIRVAVHPTMQNIEDAKIRLARSIELVGRFFNFVMPFIVIVLLSGVIMSIGFNLNAASQKTYMLTHLKELIWTIMAFNYGWMYIKRIKAQELFISGDLNGAKAKMAPLPQIMLPINIFLGILALIFGVMLRGF